MKNVYSTILKDKLDNNNPTDQCKELSFSRGKIRVNEI